ncbi:hypothetical protein [Halomarina pelagica]|uniref:hypothetical protein n=1 Tax=Halomarina pelagica TaxID=2961599 RepID=UPI0020C57237|nr:hypothetical protein [Halomarina sp. BND7]
MRTTTAPGSDPEGMSFGETVAELLARLGRPVVEFVIRRRISKWSKQDDVLHIEYDPEAKEVHGLTTAERTERELGAIGARLADEPAVVALGLHALVVFALLEAPVPPTVTIPIAIVSFILFLSIIFAARELNDLVCYNEVADE